MVPFKTVPQSALLERWTRSTLVVPRSLFITLFEEHQIVRHNELDAVRLTIFVDITSAIVGVTLIWRARPLDWCSSILVREVKGWR